jgi:hypothetical protein
MRFNLYVHLPTETLNLRLRAREVVEFLKEKWNASPTTNLLSADGVYTLPLYLNSLPVSVVKEKIVLVDLFDPVQLENIHLHWNEFYHRKVSLHHYLALLEADYLLVAIRSRSPSSPRSPST